MFSLRVRPGLFFLPALGLAGCADNGPTEPRGTTVLTVQGTVSEYLTVPGYDQPQPVVPGAELRLEAELPTENGGWSGSAATGVADAAGGYTLELTLPAPCLPADSVDAVLEASAPDLEEGGGPLRLACSPDPQTRDLSMYRLVFRTPQVVDLSSLPLQVSVGYDHACAVTDGGTWCWGRTSFGQVGDPAYGTLMGEEVPSPVQVVGGHDFTGVGAGWDHSCALDAVGKAWCWGAWVAGHLEGETETSAVPVDVAGDLPFQEVVAGRHHSCGRTAPGEVYCWGVARDLGCGSESITEVFPPQEVDLPARATQISAKFNHTCALLETSELFCWGFSYAGEVGAGEDVDGNVPYPVKVQGGRTWGRVDAGEVSTCTLTPAGEAYCWGRDIQHRLGTGSDTGWKDWPVPQPVAGGHTFASISAGHRHGCALTPQGEAYCWGLNAWGQLGLPREAGEEGIVDSPTPVDTDLRFLSIQAGATFTCGITMARELVCWGQREYLGSGRYLK